MTIMFTLLAGAIALELLVYAFGHWPRLRTILAALSLTVSGATTGALVVFEPSVFAVLFGVVTVYRMFNMIRVAERRMYEQYLRIATVRTSIILVCLQLLITAGWLAWERWHTTGHTTWMAVAAMQFVVASVLLLSVVRTIRRTQWPAPKGHYSDAELPSVTIAIPARNETEDLQQCLQSAIASDYPKLEIIVLDDCSQTKKTPEIIRGFAHEGVRFIKGSEPADTWLPKNQAYARLEEEASGAYIIFCGVDIRFKSSTVRTLISTMLDRNKEMVSVLPLRKPEAYGHVSLIQAMRYWWELVPPRRLFNRPPVLSSCWVITDKALKKAGGFAAVRRAIVPEAHFARALTKNDGYSFLRSDGLGLESTKKVREQRDTAIRMRYPQLHRRPEHTAILSFAELLFLVSPFVLIGAGFWISIGTTAHILATGASILLAITYTIATHSTQVNVPWFAIVAQPFAALADIILLHYSMWKYEFSAVDWKGRNVCVPVMRVTPHLPPVDTNTK